MKQTEQLKGINTEIKMKWKLTKYAYNLFALRAAYMMHAISFNNANVKENNKRAELNWTETIVIIISRHNIEHSTVCVFKTQQ